MKKTNYERDLQTAYRKKKQIEKIIDVAAGEISGDYINACNEYEGMKAIVNDIRVNVPNFCPEAAKTPWDAIEIEAVTMTWYKDLGKFKLAAERTDDYDKIYFYSVYLHQVEGGVECIADVHTEQQAKDLADLLRNSVQSYKDNGHLDTNYRLLNLL